MKCEPTCPDDVLDLGLQLPDEVDVVDGLGDPRHAPRRPHVPERLLLAADVLAQLPEEVLALGDQLALEEAIV